MQTGSAPLAAMKLALFLVLVAVGHCDPLWGEHGNSGPTGLQRILSGVGDVIKDPNLITTFVFDYLHKLPGCLQRALTQDLTAAARAMADFLCSDAMRKSGKLDFEAFKQSCMNFTNAMGNLGCVKPLSDVTRGLSEFVEEIKFPIVEALINNKLVVKVDNVVTLTCPFSAVPFYIYGNLFKGVNNTS